MKMRWMRRPASLSGRLEESSSRELSSQRISRILVAFCDVRQGDEGRDCGRETQHERAHHQRRIKAVRWTPEFRDRHGGRQRPRAGRSRAALIQGIICARRKMIGPLGVTGDRCRYGFAAASSKHWFRNAVRSRGMIFSASAFIAHCRCRICSACAFRRPPDVRVRPSRDQPALRGKRIGGQAGNRRDAANAVKVLIMGPIHAFENSLDVTLANDKPSVTWFTSPADGEPPGKAPRAAGLPASCSGR